ncbi:MAG: ATP-binding protein [Acidimicrobiales bacterium]
MAELPAVNDLAISAREAQVLALVGEHLTNAEIANRLFISVRTVESHVSSLLRKLQATDRRALAALAEPSVRVEGDDVEAGPWPTRRPTALPVPLTSFVGRTAERTALADAVAQHRLVTAVGPGGVGKTRLALAVAADVTDRYAQGAWYVDLVPVTDPAMVGGAAAATLGFGEQLGRSPTDTVVSRLTDAEALLVLDNCEHLVDGVVEFVERLLSACPKVSVLATSRARLLLPFESVFPVQGLSLAGVEDGGDCDAVALFLDRAAMTGWATESDGDVRRIVGICDGLDGIALAIELAAARVAALGLDGLEAGLAHPLGMLAGAARVDERHRSVRATLDWSYELLDPVSQAVLRRASVFAGAFSPDAAARVVGRPPVEPTGVAASLARLADQSLLVVVSRPGGTRYRMLETIRQYGDEQVDAVGEATDVRYRHLAWCQATAAVLDESPDGPGFDAVADDLRAALGWATGQPDRRAHARRLALVLARLAFARGLANEAQRRYVNAAALADDDGGVADALDRAAAVALSRLAGDEALQLYQSAADAARRAGDRSGVAVRLTRAVELIDRSPGLLSEVPPPERIEALRSEALDLAGDDPYVQAAVGILMFGIDESDLDFASVEDAVELAEQVGDRRLWSAALDQLTVAHLSRGRVHEAAACARRRLDLLAPLALEAEVAFEWSDALHMASMTSIGAGDLAAARRYAQERRDLVFHREDDHLALHWLLVLAALIGDWDDVVDLGEQFRVGWERAGSMPLSGWATTPAAAAMVYGLRGDEAARRWWLEVFARMRPTDDDHPAANSGYGPVFDAVRLLHRGDVDDAVATLSDPPATLTAWSSGVWRQWYAALWAEAGVVAGTADQAERIGEARRITVGNPVAGGIVDRADALANGAPGDLVGVAAALGTVGCRYQQARTLVLAGGDAQETGEQMLAAMGAIPMA